MGTTLSNINASGQILGYSAFGSSFYKFIYNAGTFTVVNSGATAFNDNGQLVGQTQDNQGNTVGFIDNSGTITTFSDPDASNNFGPTVTEPFGINNAGQIVGWYYAAGYFTGFIDNNGTFATITDPLAYVNGNPSMNGSISGGGTLPNGINNQGQIVGFFINSIGTQFGFVDTNGTFAAISDPLAAAGLFVGTYASGINDSGEVVGWFYDASGSQHGMIDNAGTFTTVDYPGAIATGVRGINNTGDLVGFYTIAGSNDEHGFEVTPDAGAASGYDFITIDGPSSLAPPPPPPPPFGRCFRAGTSIATPGGDVSVEHLAVGEIVSTKFAGTSKIRWIGHRRIECRRHRDPETVWPVRVSIDAFGDNVPHRDLYLSPDHGVFVDGVLIPIRHLINGDTIAQVQLDDVTYYHVELRDHDLLLAEGLLAESFLGTGERSNFANGGGSVRLFPDFSPRASSVSDHWETGACASLIQTGPRLDAARELVAFSTPRRRRASRPELTRSGHQGELYDTDTVAMSTIEVAAA
jgi:Hint domain